MGELSSFHQLLFMPLNTKEEDDSLEILKRKLIMKSILLCKKYISIMKHIIKLYNYWFDGSKEEINIKNEHAGIFIENSFAVVLENSSTSTLEEISNDNVIGFISYYKYLSLSSPSSSFIDIRKIFVIDKYRRKYIGSNLINTLIHQSSKENIYNIRCNSVYHSQYVLKFFSYLAFYCVIDRNMTTQELDNDMNLIEITSYIRGIIFEDDFNKLIHINDKYDSFRNISNQSYKMIRHTNFQ